jgi:hypothetical protein
VHGSRLLLAEVNCAWPLHNFLSHDAATFALPQQKERVIGLHGGAVSKPAEAAIWDELMQHIINMDAEGIPRKPRPSMEFSVQTVLQGDIMGVRIPRWPRLSVSKIGEDLLARCVDKDFVMSEQVCLLGMKAIRPMYLI